jgi:DNA primase
MAKISMTSTKYMISAGFEAAGFIEKSDVIGALFGQTEGLLGEDLELRELQKEGKIGRIETELESKGGKTTGTIKIPSALDRTETTLIAAAIETIEKIGPSETKIKIEKIQDVREDKRGFILERAKSLLNEVDNTSMKSKELKAHVIGDSREGKVKLFGDEELSMGNIEGSDLIVVEGRADVINLLRCGINNVISMNGSILPESIRKLSQEKEVTLFLDGDRGGKLIAKNVVENSRVAYIAFAPDGKEVEELTEKEIWQSLRKKVKAEELSGTSSKKKVSGSTKLLEEKIEKEKKELETLFKNKINQKTILVLNENLEELGKTSSRNLYSFIKKSNTKAKILLVEKATQPIISTAEKTGIEFILAKNFTTTGSGKTKLISI